MYRLTERATPEIRSPFRQPTIETFVLGCQSFNDSHFCMYNVYTELELAHHSQIRVVNHHQQRAHINAPKEKRARTHMSANFSPRVWVVQHSQTNHRTAGQPTLARTQLVYSKTHAYVRNRKNAASASRPTCWPSVFVDENNSSRRNLPARMNPRVGGRSLNA